MIVELRIGGNGKGAASVFPPSMHQTGEMVEWMSQGEPARVDGEELKRVVLKLAVAELPVSHYPGQGSRHTGARVIGGVLTRAGWSIDDIKDVVGAAARAAQDTEWSDRRETAAGAVNVKANGQHVSGLTKAAEVWGKDVATTLGHWLGVRSQAKGAGLEDSIALAFAEQHADDYRYVAASSQWMRWTGTRWETEDTLAAFDASRKLCRGAGDAKAKTVAAVVTLARSDRRMAATVDQWDAEAGIINTPTKEGT